MLAPVLSLLAAAAAPFPAGSVVVGISSVAGTRTELVALLPDGHRRPLGEETHRSGFLPRGQLDGDTLVLAVRAPGHDDADVVTRKLPEGNRRMVARGAHFLLGPVVHGDDVLFLRAFEKPGASTFDLVRARRGAEEVLASGPAAWMQPVRGSHDRFLRIGLDGGTALVDDNLHMVLPIGASPLRSPALVHGSLVVEHGLADERAEVIHVPSGAVLARGLRGMDPLALPDGSGRLVMGAGGKRAALVVARLDNQKLADPVTLAADRAGVASPLAAAVVDGAPVVVAWLDRGRALPGELWLFTMRGARALLPPTTGLAVEVYGVVGSTKAGAR